ncbi:MAG: cyclopropane-fatty-acyl-phospholipid synthase [Desulfobacteraceae bacterium]|nr:cyclopropane-fatty-acyl-phospholipid synthase [Desulfobacteraceae bacterium]
MNDTIMPFTSTEAERLKKRSIDQLSRRIVFKLLKQIKVGQITLIDEQANRHTFGASSGPSALTAVLHVHHPHTYTRTVFAGSIGTSEAFMAGLWSTDRLTDLIRIIILNQHLFKDLDRGWMRLTEPLYKFYHFLRRNTPSGSRENIVAHYDLGNEFYQLFLDETMTYSAGIFEHPESTLKAASIAKYDRICKKLNLSSTDHVLEIGTGWGGFALHAARNYGCLVTTTTISGHQYAMARQRIEEAGLKDRITLLKKDYRHLEGSYDKLVSIEMIEAVGHHYLGAFFKKCGDLLRDGGLMLLQAITIKDQAYDQHRRSVDFIKRYIFPGSCIPSMAAMIRAVTDKTDMNLCHMEDITRHYVRTLAEWRKRFFQNIAEVRRLGFSEAFIRMWEYYLCYCEAGFAERHIGNVQMLLAKPGFRFTS